jgi:type IV pilus assembly protein PilW
MNQPIRSRQRQAASGFSLIEILVGLLIGMLSVIVIMQVFGVFEGNKRTTTGGDDAQINGTVALDAV